MYSEWRTRKEKITLLDVVYTTTGTINVCNKHLSISFLLLVPD